MHVNRAGRMNHMHNTDTRNTGARFNNTNQIATQNNRRSQDNSNQIDTAALKDRMKINESEKMNQMYEEMGRRQTNANLQKRMENFDTSSSPRGGFRHSNQLGNNTEQIAPYESDPVVTNSYTTGDSQVDDSDEYNINIDFSGDLWTEDLKDAFKSSADYLSSIITNDVAPDGLNDLYITATLSNIDGEGGVLGQTGLTSVWSDTGLAAEATMEFDVSDLSSYENTGLLDDVVLHEMLHAVGFGTLWEANNLVQTTTVDGTYQPVFTGENATLYNDGTNPIIETDGGTGTALAHWDEDTYSNELMTGYIDDQNYLSKMTLGSLEDLGYDINYDSYNA